MNELPFTGERFVPGTKGEIWIEHWHRYHFASRWTAGKRVLDVACGEGYGTALLARDAAQVTGVDLSQAAIDHAKAAYAGLSNVAFTAASCTRLPLPDASVDVAVSFETIEHIAEHDAFLDELARVLRTDGVLILSCPNKLEYSDKRGFRNEFHVRELYREELAKLVQARFAHLAWYGQRPTFFSLIAPEETGVTEGQVVEVDEADPLNARGSLTNPLYFMVVASRQRQSLTAVPPALSVLADRGDWVHRDYEKVMRDLEATVARGEGLETQMAERERSIAGLQEEVRALQHARAEQDSVAGARDAMLATRNAEIAARDSLVAERDREIARRGGWRWWLRLPFVRLGLIKRLP